MASASYTAVIPGNGEMSQVFSRKHTFVHVYVRVIVNAGAADPAGIVKQLKTASHDSAHKLLQPAQTAWAISCIS